jgi:hypothetical protein
MQSVSQDDAQCADLLIRISGSGFFEGVIPVALDTGKPDAGGQLNPSQAYREIQGDIDWHLQSPQKSPQ